jgi:hypothetical protein
MLFGSAGAEIATWAQIDSWAESAP